MRYRKKPVIIEATQWFKNGDHPMDDCYIIQPPNDQSAFLSEGKIVRYFRDPQLAGTYVCSRCNTLLHKHGWIDTLEGGHRVCPGDYIVTGVHGEHYPCKPDIFEKTYEKVCE